MKKIISNDRGYGLYKNNLIFESLISVPDRNRFYGLSREHIELTLAIKVPMLLESIDFRLEDKILREQYLFEAWYNSLATAAGSAASAVGTGIQAAGRAVAGAARGAARMAVGAVIGKVKDAAGIFKALGLIFQYPTLVNELGQSLSLEIDKFLTPMLEFFNKVITWCGVVVNKIKDFLKSAFTKAYDMFTNLLNKFRGLKGWQQVALGLGALVLAGTAWQQLKLANRIKALKEMLNKAMGEATGAIGKASKGAGDIAAKVADYVGDDVADAAKETAEKTMDAAKERKEALAAGVVAGAESSKGGALALAAGIGGGVGAGKDLLKQIAPMAEGVTKELLKELSTMAKDVIIKLGAATTVATLSNFFAPAIGPFLLSVGVIVGNAPMIVTILSPVTNTFIDKYNAIIGTPSPNAPPQSPALPGATPPPTPRTPRSLGPSTTQKVRSAVGSAAGAVRSAVGLEEHSVLLSDLLYM